MNEFFEAINAHPVTAMLVGFWSLLLAAMLSPNRSTKVVMSNKGEGS